MTCFLETLSSPILPGPHPGVVWSSDKGLEVGELGCCRSDGIQLHPEGTRRCGFLGRLRKLEAFYGQFQKTWPKETALPVLSKKLENAFHFWLSKAFLEAQPKGYGFKRKNPEQPSLLWSLGAMALWRYDCHVLLFQTLTVPYPRMLQAVLGSTQNNTLVLLEIQGKFSAYQEELEALVGLCDQTGFPLWIDYPEQSQSSSLKPPPFSSPAFRHFKARLDRQASQPPFAQVGEGCRSRFQSLFTNGKNF
jgi:hypothetical protein